MHGYIVHDMLVAELVPVTHASLAQSVRRTQWWGVGKGILQVFADHCCVGDQLAVVVEHRHLALGVDRDEPRLVLFELVQVDIQALKIEALLLEGDEGLQGVGDGLGVVELQHDLAFAVKEGSSMRFFASQGLVGAGGRAWSIATSAGSVFSGIAAISAV